VPYQSTASISDIDIMKNTEGNTFLFVDLKSGGKSAGLSARPI
jgi:hypothetical protein